MDALTSLDPAQLSSATPNAFSELNSEEFVKIMFTELGHQDPLKPNDSAALLQQMSSLRSIQSDIELSNKLQSLVNENQLASAGNMIGRLVSGLTEDNLRVYGTVISVSRTDHGPILNLNNGFRVPFSSVDEMTDPPRLPGGGGDTPNPPPPPPPPVPPATT